MSNNQAAAPSAIAPPAPDPRRWFALPLVLAAMFMAQFDLFVVNVAAPSLQGDLGAGPVALELIVGGYAFTYAAGLVTGGRLGDLVGHKRMFLVGTTAFVVASLLCGIAQSPSQLVVARLLQGLTAAAMVPQVLALITATFPVAERARALAWFGVTMGVGAVAGQVLGGALLQADVLGLGWRVIFLVNLPIGLVAVALGLRLLPEARSAVRPRLDIVGALGVSVAVGLLLVPLVIGRSQGWPVWAWVCIVASVPAMFLALRWERRLAARGGQPILDVTLFHDSVFNKGLLVNIAAFASFHSWMFTMTLLLQSGIGLNPLQAGLTFMPLGLAFAGASIGGRGLVARLGSGAITLGACIAAVGLAAMVVLLSVVGGNVTALMVVVPMMVVGFGNGLAVPALIATVLAGVKNGKAGAAAGVLTTSQQFASAAGIAVIGGVFFSTLVPQLGTAGYAHSSIWVSALSGVVALVAVGLSLRLPRPVKAKAAPLPEPTEQEAEQEADLAAASMAGGH